MCRILANYKRFQKGHKSFFGDIRYYIIKLYERSEQDNKERDENDEQAESIFDCIGQFWNWTCTGCG